MAAAAWLPGLRNPHLLVQFDAGAPCRQGALSTRANLARGLLAADRLMIIRSGHVLDSLRASTKVSRAQVPVLTRFLARAMLDGSGHQVKGDPAAPSGLA